MKKKKLKELLTITEKDWTKYLEETGEEGRRHVEMHRSLIDDPVAFPTSFAFNCVTCEEAAPWLNPYQINKSRNPVIPTTKGIFLIKNLNVKPEYNTKLYYVEGEGYVCAHCLVSVHSGEDEFMVA